MGKAILIIVLGAGLFTARGLLSAQQTEHETRKQQGSYEENVLAREIARSGFNVAMGKLRQYGDSLHFGINDINGEQGYMEGEYQGGIYRVRVEPVTGHSVEIVSKGYYGGAFNEHGEYRKSDGRKGATHEMDDTYGKGDEYHLPTPPLQAKTCGDLQVEFLQSEAGYCSAVFLQRKLLGVSDADQPAPEMIFAAGHNRTGGNLTVEKKIQSGTQMNFFIGVDKNCSTEPYDWRTYDYEGHTYRESDYDHVHYGLSGEVDDLGRMEESVWGLIEQHPNNNQRWRIAWEDQHITNWDRPNSDDPSESLQATKRYGYDGDGWPDEDGWGYRELRDYGSRPDFSDQVIDVRLTPTTGCDPLALAETEEPAPEEPAPEEPAPEEPEPEEEEEAEEEETSSWCFCPKHSHQTHKVGIWHQLPNQKKGKFNCIAESAVEHHLKNHNDFVVCRGD
jgi:hypothetical protein